MTDNVLLITVLVLLTSGLISAFLRSRSRDICLKSFAGYMATVKMKTGKRMWGRMLVASTGIELKYRADHVSEGHIESSYILYKAEYPLIELIVRFHDELDAGESRRREWTSRISFRPGPGRRLGRQVRNYFISTKDAVMTGLGALFASRQATGAAAATQQKAITGTSADVLESWGNSFDPVLERHIGATVIVARDATTQFPEKAEYVGRLREYSPDFLELIDVDLIDGESARRADILVPRLHAFIRHSGEKIRPDALKRGIDMIGVQKERILKQKGKQ